MSRKLAIPTHQLFFPNVAKKILFALLLTFVAAIPLWLGLQRVQSASATTASPPPAPSPSPAVALSVPAQTLIGSQIKFKVTFSNANAIGYAPFLDVVLDAGGAGVTKPGCACDGMTFVSAKMVGVNGGPIDLTSVSKIITTPCANAPNTIPHPFAANGILPVTVPPGAQLVSIPLPFGSFDPTQPPAQVEITANISNFADANWPLKTSARGGFLLGTDPLDNPVPDRPILSDETSTGSQITNSTAWNAQAQTTPVVMLISKAYLGPEGENATGPNFIGFYPLRYSLTVQVAPGQTVTNVVLTDCLPDNMAYHQLVSVTPAVPTSAIVEPAIDTAASSNCLTVTWASLSGTGSVVFEFFIPEKDAFGNPVLPPDCKPAISQDSLKVEADWTPLDPCDTPAHIVSGPVVDKLKDKCIAIQKSVKLASDTGAPGYTPGDLLEYTLNFQISDYKTFGSINIVDSLSDGQQLLVMPPALTPKLSVTDQFGSATGYFVLNNDVSAVPDGNMACGAGTRITFKVSQKMIDLAPANPRLAAGILTGGHATTPTSTVPATGQIVFYARILDQFSFPHPGDQYVDKEDPLNNCVTIGGKVLTNVNPPAMPTSTGFDAQDDSSTAIAIVGDTLTKTVYAVSRKNALNVYNPVCGPGSSGGACSNFPLAPQEVRAGDRVTYRLEKVIPSNDAEKLSITDWLPRPAFNLTSTSFPFANYACGVPAPGTGCFGSPHDPPGPLSVVADPVTNSIKFDFGTFFDVTNPQRQIDLLFTNTVTNIPFADGLHHTNVAQECEENTFGARFCQVAIAQINLREPRLKIRKGVIATNNPWGQFSQAPTLPFATLGLNGISGQVRSVDLQNGLLNADLTNVDANDVVTFAVTIENVGGAPAYDVKMQDLIPLDTFGNPSCFTIVPNTFKVQRGTGAAVLPAFYNIGFPLANHGFTVTSTPLLPIPISAYTPTSGANIVVITFQVKMLANVMPGCCDNRANLLHYSSEVSGQDFVAANLTPPFTETATVCVKPALTKSLVTTSEAHTSGSSVTIGELARYRLLVQLPETALLPNFQITDVLPAGLKFVPDNSARIAFVSNGPGIARPFPLSFPIFNASTIPTSAALNSMPAIPLGISSGGTGCGSPVTFTLGNIKNNDNDSDLEYIVIEFNAQVCNITSNVNGATLPNTFGVSVNNAVIATSPAVNVTVVEPKLTITKTASPLTVAQGGTVNYAVQVENTGTATAFDVTFSDTLPAGLTPTGPVNISPAVLGCSGSLSGITCPQIPAMPNPNSTVTITYHAVANPTSCPATLTNQAAVRWTSLKGPKGTAVNPTNSNPTTVLGAPGTATGERDGITSPLTLNTYSASASKAVTVSCPPCTSPPQGMSAWWPFDEANGATLINDIAGVNNQGAPKPASPIGAANAPGSVPGKVSGALKFNSGGASTGPNIEVPNHPEINFGTGNFSIDAWVLVPQPPAIYFHPIVDKLQMNSAGTAGTGYALNLISSFSNGARLQFTMGDGGTLVNYGPNVPSVLFNTWTQVTVTVNRSSGVVTFYVNGIQLPPAAAAMPSGSLDNTLPLLIGESRFLGLGQQAIVIDELEMFKRVLPLQPDVLNIVNAGGGGKCKCLNASNESITCGVNGSFNYTFTVTNLSTATATGVTFAPSGGVTITPGSLTIPPLPPGASTNVTVTISGPAAVSGANICFSVGLIVPPPSHACRVTHCITLPACSATGSLTVNKTIFTPAGLTPPPTAAFPVTVACQPSGYNQSFNLTPSLLTQTFTGIPLGDSCTVTEGPLPTPFGNPVCAALGWAPPVYSPGQTVTVSAASQTVSIKNRFGCSTCAAPPSGMVGWWPLNVQSNQVNDIAPAPVSLFNNVGNAQAYQPVNGYVTGPGFGALYFNTTPPSVVSVPSHPELNFVNGDFSIDAWVSIVSGSTTAIHPIVDKLNAPGGPGFAFYVRNKRLELNLNGVQFVSTGPAMVPAVNPQGNSGPWYHVAVTVQRNPARVIFYLNGGQVGTYSPTSIGPVVNNLPLWIGGTRLAGTRLELAIDELELFNRVVTQTEIQQVFSAGGAGKCRQGIPQPAGSGRSTGVRR